MFHSLLGRRPRCFLPCVLLFAILVFVLSLICLIINLLLMITNHSRIPSLDVSALLRPPATLSPNNNLFWLENSNSSNVSPGYDDSPSPDALFDQLGDAESNHLDSMFGDIKKDSLVAFMKILETASSDGSTIVDLTTLMRRHIAKRAFAPPAVKNWNRELQQLLDTDPCEEKYLKLRELAHDFNLTAEVYAKILISELFLSPSEKTIPPSTIGGLAGGTKFICQGILFKFAVDVQLPNSPFWMYGKHTAATEYAMKAAGSELRHIVAFSNAVGETDLRVPLMALIDYRGFRLVASSLLPIASHTIVYGSDNAGFNVYARPDVAAKFDLVAKRLNLKRHIFSDVAISGPVDIEVHKGEDDRLYVIDVARLMPPEAPDLTLIPHPRSNYFKLLRPCLVFKNNLPLSSDAFSGFGRNNEEEHNEDVWRATKWLQDVVIPDMALALSEGKYKIKTSQHLCQILHKAGINLRYLGLLRTHLLDTDTSNGENDGASNPPIGASPHSGSVTDLGALAHSHGMTQSTPPTHHLPSLLLSSCGSAALRRDTLPGSSGSLVSLPSTNPGSPLSSSPVMAHFSSSYSSSSGANHASTAKDGSKQSSPRSAGLLFDQPTKNPESNSSENAPTGFTSRRSLCIASDNSIIKDKRSSKEVSGSNADEPPSPRRKKEAKSKKGEGLSPSNDEDNVDEAHGLHDTENNSEITTGHKPARQHPASLEKKGSGIFKRSSQLSLSLAQSSAPVAIEKESTPENSTPKHNNKDDSSEKTSSDENEENLVIQPPSITGSNDTVSRSGSTEITPLDSPIESLSASTITSSTTAGLTDDSQSPQPKRKQKSGGKSTSDSSRCSSAPRSPLRRAATAKKLQGSGAARGHMSNNDSDPSLASSGTSDTTSTKPHDTPPIVHPPSRSQDSGLPDDLNVLRDLDTSASLLVLQRDRSDSLPPSPRDRAYSLGGAPDSIFPPTFHVRRSDKSSHLYSLTAVDALNNSSSPALTSRTTDHNHPLMQEKDKKERKEEKKMAKKLKRKTQRLEKDRKKAGKHNKDSTDSPESTTPDDASSSDSRASSTAYGNTATSATSKHQRHSKSVLTITVESPTISNKDNDSHNSSQDSALSQQAAPAPATSPLKAERASVDQKILESMPSGDFDEAVCTSAEEDDSVAIKKASQVDLLDPYSTRTDHGQSKRTLSSKLSSSTLTASKDSSSNGYDRDSGASSNDGLASPSTESTAKTAGDISLGQSGATFTSPGDSQNSIPNGDSRRSLGAVIPGLSSHLPPPHLGSLRSSTTSRSSGQTILRHDIRGSSTTLNRGSFSVTMTPMEAFVDKDAELHHRKSISTIRQVVLREMIARAIKCRLRQAWRRTMQAQRISIEAPFADVALQLLNTVFYKLGDESENFWRVTLIQDLEAKFAIGLSPEELSGQVSLYHSIDGYLLFKSICDMTAIRITWTPEQLYHPERRFMYTDIESINCVVRPMNIITISEGILLSMMASAEPDDSQRLELLNMAEKHLQSAYSASFNPLVTAELGHVRYARMMAGSSEDSQKDAEAAFVCYVEAVTQYKAEIESEISAPVLARTGSLGTTKSFLHTSLARLLELAFLNLSGSPNLLRMTRCSNFEDMYVQFGRWMLLMHKTKPIEEANVEGTVTEEMDPTIHLFRRVLATQSGLPLLLATLRNAPQPVLDIVIKELRRTQIINLVGNGRVFIGSGESSFPALVQMCIDASPERNPFWMPAVQVLNLKDVYTLMDKHMEILLPVCPNLVQIDVSGCRRLTSRIARALPINRMSAIRYLSLAQCSGIDDDFFLDSVHLLHSLVYLDVSECNLLTETALFILSRRSSQLLHLSLSGCTGIGSLQNLNQFSTLESFECARCPALESEQVAYFLRAESPLRRLVISGNPQIDDQAFDGVESRLVLQEFVASETNITAASIEKLSQYARGLTVLELNDCTKLVLDSLGEKLGLFSRLTTFLARQQMNFAAGALFTSVSHTLKAVDISMSSHSVQAMLIKSCPTSLTSLAISRCNELVSNTLVDIGQFRRLTALNMSGCVNVNDFVLQSLLEKLHYISRLELSYCAQLTSAAVVAIGKHCPHLRLLDLESCVGIDQPRFTELGYGCQGLSELRFSRLNLKHPSIIKSLFRGALGSLRIIKMKDCNLVDESIKEIANYSPSLAELDLSDNIDITNVGIKHLFAQCHLLEQLLLTGAQLITDEAFPKTSKRRMRSLRVVGLSGCKLITDETVHLIAKRSPLMSSLDLSGCNNISKAACKSLVRKLPYLSELRVLFCENVPTGSLDIAPHERASKHLRIVY